MCLYVNLHWKTFVCDRIQTLADSAVTLINKDWSVQINKKNRIATVTKGEFIKYKQLTNSMCLRVTTHLDSRQKEY